MSVQISKLQNIFHSLGPGILLAATAIGVSHIVQSVQAGAKYGYLFIAMIFLAHIVKYPFFEAAPRYSSATKKTLLDGYYDIGHSYLIIYLILTIISMFTILSAVTVVAAGILANIVQYDFSIQLYSCLLYTSDAADES